MARKPGTGKRAKFCPSWWGGKDWPPAAYSPKTGYLYIPANENLCSWLEGEEVEYRRGQVYMGTEPEEAGNLILHETHQAAALSSGVGTSLAVR